MADDLMTEYRARMQRDGGPNKLTKSRDKEGHTLLSRHAGTTTLSRYTELHIDHGPNVLVFHDRKLSQNERDKIRGTVIQARQDVDSALGALSSQTRGDGLSSNASQLLQHHYCKSVDGIYESDLQEIKNKFSKIREGLNNPDLRIKITSDLSDKAHYSAADSEHGQTGGLAKVRNYYDPSEPMTIRLNTGAAQDSDRGAEVLVSAMGYKAAHLHDHGDKGYSRPNLHGPSGPYLEQGLTFENALDNSNSFAAFSADLRRCGSIDLAKEFQLSKLDGEGPRNVQTDSGFNLSRQYQGRRANSTPVALSFDAVQRANFQSRPAGADRSADPVPSSPPPYSAGDVSNTVGTRTPPSAGLTRQASNSSDRSDDTFHSLQYPNGLRGEPATAKTGQPPEPVPPQSRTASLPLPPQRSFEQQVSGTAVEAENLKTIKNQLDSFKAGLNSTDERSRLSDQDRKIFAEAIEGEIRHAYTERGLSEAGRDSALKELRRQMDPRNREDERQRGRV